MLSISSGTFETFSILRLYIIRYEEPKIQSLISWPWTSVNYITAYLFPLGNWSWSINSRCLSDGRLSHRNLSKNFFLCESSRLLSEAGPALLMKLGSRPWNSNLALEPITWFGGKNWVEKSRDSEIVINWICKKSSSVSHHDIGERFSLEAFCLGVDEK